MWRWVVISKTIRYLLELLNTDCVAGMPKSNHDAENRRRLADHRCRLIGGQLRYLTSSFARVADEVVGIVSAKPARANDVTRPYSGHPAAPREQKQVCTSSLVNLCQPEPLFLLTFSANPVDRSRTHNRYFAHSGWHFG